MQDAAKITRFQDVPMQTVKRPFLRQLLIIMFPLILEILILNSIQAVSLRGSCGTSLDHGVTDVGSGVIMGSSIG
ncbi:unnamed protein product [Prunus armeniaca]